MYQPIRQQFYEFVSGLIALVTDSNLWWIAGPFVLMGVVLWFIRWVRATARGERMEDLSLDIEDSIVQGQTMMSPGYSQLRQQGFSTDEIVHLRRQQAGSPVRRMSNRRSRIK